MGQMHKQNAIQNPDKRNMKREKGFYRVKIQGIWTVAEHDYADRWILIGSTQYITDENEFDEIDERKIEFKI